MKRMDTRNRTCRNKHSRKVSLGFFLRCVGWCPSGQIVEDWLISSENTMLPLQSVQNGMDLNLLFLFLQPYLIPHHCFISLYRAPLSPLDLLTSAISSNSTSSSLSVPGCVPLWSRFCSGSFTHTRKGTSASCYSFLPQASSLISSYSQSSFFQLKYFF